VQPREHKVKMMCQPVHQNLTKISKLTQKQFVFSVPQLKKEATFTESRAQSPCSVTYLMKID